MINTIKKLVKPKPHETLEVVFITCDVCKKEYEIDDTFEIQEFYHITHQCGYGSVFGDGEVLKIDICQHCLKKIIEEKCGDIKNFIVEE